VVRPAPAREALAAGDDGNDGDDGDEGSVRDRPDLAPAFERVARALSFVEGFTLMPVEVTGPDLAWALASWLAARGMPTRVVEPLDELGWRGIVASVLDGESPHSGPSRSSAEDGSGEETSEVPARAVMVIGPRRVTQGMAAGLSLANQRRDTIVEELSCPLLWCGPLDFLNATWERAPDLWSIRGMAYRIEADARAPAESPLWAGVIAREAPERLRETLRMAREQGDRDVIARLAVQLAEALLASGEYMEAAEVIDDAVRDVSPLSGRLRESLALLRARAASALGDGALARAALGDAEAIAKEGGRRDSFSALVATARGNLALGESASVAKAAYEEALAAARASGDRRNEGVALADLGIAELALGEATSALSRLEEARAILRDGGDERSEARSLLHLGRAHAALFDARAAAACFEEALELVRGQGDRRGEARVLCHVARAYLDAGDAEKAREDAQRALTLARASEDERLVARAEAVLAEARGAGEAG
jgi:tetratricopeptide (TPR) repeat protein